MAGALTVTFQLLRKVKPHSLSCGFILYVVVDRLPINFGGNDLIWTKKKNGLRESRLKDSSRHTNKDKIT